MGIFDSFKSHKETIGTCFICRSDVTDKHYVLSDGKCICPICAFQKGVGNDKLTSLSSNNLISSFKSSGLSLPSEFSPSKRIIRSTCAFGDSSAVPLKYSYLEIDDTNGLINLPTVEICLIGKNKYNENIRPISSLIDFQLIDSGQKIVDGGSFAGAALGGAAFGGVGAIVGSSLRSKKVQDVCTDLSIKLIFNDISHSTEYIYFIGGNSGTAKVKRGSKGFSQLYDLAQECLSVLTIICNNDHAAVSAPDPDITDSIKKLSELHDAGILTDSEFSGKKAELLARI
jgi:hypothetical protein